MAARTAHGLVNGADLFARALKAQGVEWISTLCGHGLNEVYASCRRAGLRLIDVRNEQTAAYMAECWGRLSRSVGVCAVSSGVAHVNGMTGVVNAHFDGAPMLLLTGAGPLQTAGMGHFQDFDQIGLAAPMCKYAQVLDTPERIPACVHEAFAAALGGRPGPVHLTFPMDVQVAEVEAEVSDARVGLSAGMVAAAEDIDRVVDLLAAAQRPLLVVGNGAYYAGAERALAAFAAAFAVPVAVPIWDRGIVSQALAEYVGVVGAASGGPALLGEADLVLALGVAADYRVGYLQGPDLAADARVIRVDVDPLQLAKNGPATLALEADPAVVLEQLHEACTERQIDGFEVWLAEVQRRKQRFEREVVEGVSRDAALHGLDVVEVLEEVLDPETVLVVDGGNIGQWFHQTLGRRRYPGHWLSCGASGVVGYGIAGAMAARAGMPQRPVVLLSGDGAATFNLTELECAARQRLPFVMIVADDESWGIVEVGHQAHYGEAMCSALGPIEFADLARSLGALGARVESKEELKDMLQWALREQTPALIHAPIAGGLPGA